MIDDQIVTTRDQRKIDRFIALGLIAAHEAITDSGFIADENTTFRSGVMVGSGIGGLDTIYKNSSILDNQGIRKISPFFIPSSLIKYPDYFLKLLRIDCAIYPIRILMAWLELK